MGATDNEPIGSSSNDSMMFDGGNLLHNCGTIVRAGPHICEIEMLFYMTLTRLDDAVMLSTQSQGLQELRSRN
eukprot:3178873-Amphidinium_carterae.2